MTDYDLGSTLRSGDLSLVHAQFLTVEGTGARDGKRQLIRLTAAGNISRAIDFRLHLTTDDTAIDVT